MDALQRLVRALFALAALVLASAATADGPQFRLGVVNERSDKPDHALGQFGAFHGHLKGALAGDGVMLAPLVIAQSLQEMAGRIRAGDVDAVIEGVMPSIYLDDLTGDLEPALLVWRKGQRQYHSVFFVREDSPIRSLADLEGQRIAFESHRSTSAYFIPVAALAETGLAAVPDEAEQAPGQRTVRYLFAGSETNQGYWTLMGKTDAGAFNNGDWERLPEGVRARLRIIHRTRPVLRWLVSFRRDLPEPVREAVTRALTRMHESPAGVQALRQAERITRIEVLDEADRKNLDAWRPVLGTIKPLL